MNLNGKIFRMGRAALCTMALLCLMAASALGETKIVMNASEDWTWERGGSSAITGSITPDQDLAEAKLTLEAEISAENPGQVLFMSVGGKKVKIRKRAPTVEADLTAGQETAFEAEWTVPEELENDIAHAVFRLRVEDSSGKEIAASTLEVGSLETESLVVGSSPVQIAEKLILWMGVAAAALWALAVLRFLILRRTGKRKEAV